MNACQETQSLLFEHADGRVAAGPATELEAHLAACPHCRRVVARWTGALPKLRALAPDGLSAVTLRRMENEIVRALAIPAPPRRRLSTWLALAAAVALLAGAGVLATRSTTPPAFARIESLWGRVTLSGVAMSKGATVGPGGVLEIAAEGEAAFQVGRATEVRLFGPGRVAFDGTLARPHLRLDSGRLAVQIAHRRADEAFAVSTTHGRIEVRGTRFVVGYTAAGSYVHVEEGEVAAFRRGSSAPLAVKAGETFALAAEPPPVPEGPPVAPAPEPPSCPKAACDQASVRVRRTMRAGDPARAVELVDAALAEAASCAPPPRCLDELGYLRAEALRQTGRLDAAVAAYKTLNRTSATRATRQNALYAAAQLERRLGRTDEARSSFERAFATHPDGALAEESLAALLELASPGTAEARATAEAYLRRYPQGMAAGRARRLVAAAPHGP